MVAETTVQARHITELRTAIDAMRARAGMAAYPWTTSATTNDYINANPIIEMRTALDQALGAPPSGYSAGLAQNQPIKAVHIQELRDRLMAAWGIDIRWLVTDQLGTPRMVFDQSGSLSGVSRHDYLPFGEELYAGTGGRSTAQGYSIGDGARQKFTQKERDNETGLDYFLARYHSSSHGRFTSPDPFMGSGKSGLPQSWNRYTYSLNNPLLLTDPNGLIWGTWSDDKGTKYFQWFEDNDAMNASGHKNIEEYTQSSYDLGNGYSVRLNPRGPEGAAGWAFRTMAWSGFGLAWGASSYKYVANGWDLQPSYKVNGLATGAVEEKPEHIIAAVGLGQGLLSIAGSAIDAFAGPSVRGMVGDVPASTPVGRSGGIEMNVAAPGDAPWNSPGTVSGRQYSGHAFDQMQSRGITPSAVENTIQSGQPSLGNQPNSTLHYDPANNLTVVTNSSTGRVVTVRQGKP